MSRLHFQPQSITDLERETFADMIGAGPPAPGLHPLAFVAGVLVVFGFIVALPAFLAVLGAELAAVLW